MTIAGGYPDIKPGVKWIGTEGWVWVDRGGFDASNPAWREGKSLPRELRKVKLYTSTNHQQNFLDCVRTREATITPVQVGHHSAIPGHLCLISMLEGRKIRWDVKEEKIIGDPAASKQIDPRISGPMEDELIAFSPQLSATVVPAADSVDLTERHCISIWHRTEET